MAPCRAARSRNPKAVRMDDLTRTIAARGDLAHLVLFLWASAASALVLLLLKQLTAANERFDRFVRELARFNNRYGDN